LTAVRAVKEALALLLLGDVEKEFQDHGAVARQITLEGGDVLEALAPDVFRDQLRRKSSPSPAVRDAPASPGTPRNRKRLKMPMRPRSGSAIALRHKEVMVEFVRGRLLERGDLAALRVDAFEDRLDRGESLPEASMPWKIKSNDQRSFA